MINGHNCDDPSQEIVWICAAPRGPWSVSQQLRAIASIWSKHSAFGSRCRARTGQGSKIAKAGNMPTCHQRNKRLFQWPPWHTLATKLLNQSGGQCTMFTRSQKLIFCQGRIPYAFPAWLASIYFYICKFGKGNAKGR